MPISNNLKDIRSKRQLTQGQLGQLAEIELAQIWRIERGTTQPKLETIKKLALALKCSTDELIFDGHEQSMSEKLTKLLHAIDQLPDSKKVFAIEFLEALVMKSEAENWIKNS